MCFIENWTDIVVVGKNGNEVDCQAKNVNKDDDRVLDDRRYFLDRRHFALFLSLGLQGVVRFRAAVCVLHGGPLDN